MDKSARYGKGEHCENGQCGTIVARVDNAGGKNVSKLAQLRRCCTIGLGYIDFVHRRNIEIRPTKQTQISKY